MSFLPIAERELSVAARRRATYWMRFVCALVAVVIWLVLLIAGQGSSAEKAQMLFTATGVIGLAFGLFAGIFLTADCLSEEKREGTLGLLFLTDLKGYDVVLGKLLATSLHAFYGLLSTLPLLALPLLMGGVTAGEFWRVTLVLVTTLTLSLAVGMAVSAISSDTRQAMATTLMILVVLAGFLPLLYWVLRLLRPSSSWDALLWTSPPYAYARAFDAWYGFRGGPTEFLSTWLTLLGVSAGALLLGSLCLPRVWRERGEDTGRRPQNSWRRRLRFGTARQRARRRDRLEVNPFYWLASRDRSPGWLAALILLPLFAVWLGFSIGFFSRVSRVQNLSISAGFLLAYGLHQLLKWLIAIESSRRLSDDRQSGALELLLVSPLQPAQILAGQRRALRRAFFWPAALVLAVNTIFFLLLLGGPPALRMPRDARFVFCEIMIGGAMMLLVDYQALTWIGMHMALRTKRHHRAILATLARVVLPPWLLLLFFFCLTLYGSGPRQETLVVLVGIWFGLAVAADLVLATKARIALQQLLRPSAEPMTPLNWARFNGEGSSSSDAPDVRQTG